MNALLRSFSYLVRLQHTYANPVNTYRARLLLTLSDVVFLVSAIIVIATYLANLAVGSDLIYVLGGLLIVVTPLVIILVQQGNLRYASYLFVVSALLFIVINSFATVRPPAPLLALIPLLLASALLSAWEVLVVMLAIVIMHLYFTIGLEAPNVSSNALIGASITSGAYMVVSMLMVVTSRWINATASQFRIEITRMRDVTFPLLRLNLSTDETTFINQAIESIAANLAFPTVRVYLFDSSSASTVRLVQPGTPEDQHPRQPVDPGSGFASVLQTRQSLYIDQNSTAAERIHFLPGTTLGALIPLVYRDQVVGILDVQSVNSRPIDPGARELLNLVALHMATTIGNARLLDQMQQDLKQQQEVILRQRNRLRQIEQTEQQAIVTAWTDYLDQRDQRIIGFDINEVSMQLIPTDYLPDHMRQALERNDVAMYEEDNIQHVTLPIQLRGQTLGAASFSVPHNRPITRRQVEIMRNVIQRLALALDNKRLFEQSQSQAQRESKANDIASLLLSSTDIDAVLRIAATSFNDALGAVQTHIELFSDAMQPAQEERA